MTNVQSTMRGLLIYGLVIPVALVFGYLLATRSDAGLYIDWSTWGPIGAVLGLISAPLLLKWHHPLLFLTWNMSAVLFFFPGSPPLWFAATGLSLILSLVHRMMDREMRFISIPSIMWPLAYLAAVVFFTARFTGGFGMRVLGGGTYGGRRYWLIFAGLAGFLAMTAQEVPRRQALLYTGLFFLGYLENLTSAVIPLLPRELYWLAAIFPVSGNDLGALNSHNGVFEAVGRYSSLSIAFAGVFLFLLARYGIREMLSASNIWRFLLFLISLVLNLLGGYRSSFIFLAMVLLLVFYFEGLVRSKYLGILLAGTALGFALVVPFSDKLPLAIQRTLSFLPLKLDPIARYEAEYSTDWRLRVWRVALPEIPRYFWTGKGLGINGQDLELTAELQRRGLATAEDSVIMTDDYHNGPLSVIIPFGIWGTIGWLWLLGASVRAMWLNYRYGDESLRKINTFLLAYFLGKILFFFLIYGSFYSDVAIFAGIIGLNLAVNGGITKPARAHALTEAEPAPQEQLPHPFRPLPGPV